MREASLLGTGVTFKSHFSGIGTAELALDIITRAVAAHALGFHVQLQPVSACVVPTCLPSCHTGEARVERICRACSGNAVLTTYPHALPGHEQGVP